MNGDLLGLGTAAYAKVEEDANKSHTTDGVDVDALAARSHVPFSDDPVPPPPPTAAGTIDLLSGSPVKRTGKDTIVDDGTGDDNLLGFAQPPPQLQEQEASPGDNLIAFGDSGGEQQIGTAIATATVDLFEPVAPPPTSSSDPFPPQPTDLIQPPVSDPFAPPSDVLHDQPNQILSPSNDYPNDDPFAPVAPLSDPFAVLETGNVQQQQQQQESSIHVSAPQSSFAPMETLAQSNIPILIPSPEKALERPAALFSSIGDDVQSMVKNPIPSSTVQYPPQNQSQETNGTRQSNRLKLVDGKMNQHQQKEEEHQQQTDPVEETSTLAKTSQDGIVQNESGTHPNPKEIQNESPSQVSESPNVKEIGESTDKADEACRSDPEGRNHGESERPSNTETPSGDRTLEATEESSGKEKNPEPIDDDANDSQEQSGENDSESSHPADGSENHVKQQQQPLDSEGSMEEEKPPTNNIETEILQEQSADEAQKSSQPMDKPIKVENGSQELSVAANIPDGTLTTVEQTVPAVLKGSEVEKPEASNDSENIKAQQAQTDDSALESPTTVSDPVLVQNEPDGNEAEKESSEQSPDNNPKLQGRMSGKPDNPLNAVSESETMDGKSDADGVIADEQNDGVPQGSSISSGPEKAGDEPEETIATGNQEESHEKRAEEEEDSSEPSTFSGTPDSISPDAATSSENLSAEASDDNHQPPTPNPATQETSSTPDSAANDKREKILIERAEALEKQLSAAEALIAELQYTEAEKKHENDRILSELQSSLQKEMTKRAEAEDAARRASAKATALDEEFSVYKKETAFQIESFGEDLATTVKENTAMKDELEQIRAERDEQARNEAALTHRLNSAKKKEGEQAHAAEIFERRTDQLQAELTQTTDKLALVTAERDCLKKDVANWKQFAEEKTRKLDSALKSERKHNDERKKKMKSFVEAKTEEVRLAKSDHLSLQTELDQTNQSLKDLNQRFKQLHTQWVESQTRCRELQRDITKMKTDSEKMSKVGGTLEAKLSRSAMEAEGHKNKRLAAKNELMALLRQLEAEKEVNNRLRDTIKETFTTKALSQQQTMCDVLDSFEGALQRLALRLNRPVPRSGRATDSTDGQQPPVGDNDASIASGRENGFESIGISDTNTTLVLNKLDAETKRVNDYVMSFADNVDRMNELVDGSHSRGCVDALQKLVGGRPTIASSDERTARNGLRLPSRGPRYGQVPANADIT